MTLPHATRAIEGPRLNSKGHSGRWNSSDTCVSLYVLRLSADVPTIRMERHNARTVRPRRIVSSHLFGVEWLTSVWFEFAEPALCGSRWWESSISNVEDSCRRGLVSKLDILEGGTVRIVVLSIYLCLFSSYGWSCLSMRIKKQ